MRTYTLLGRDGTAYESATAGTLGGHRRTKVYGRLDCSTALRWIAMGKYVQHRVFFADESVAVAAGHQTLRPLPAAAVPPVAVGP